MNRAIVAGSLVATLFLSACADSEQTLGGYDKTVIGAGTGAVLGGVAGVLLDKDHRGRGAAIGAAAGAALGGGVGYLFDRQEDEFRAALAEQQRMHQAEVERIREDLLKITIQNEVMFDFGKADLKPAFIGTIDKLAEVLKKYDRSAATIFGYTDSVGSEAFNQQLSVRRADAVMAALAERGVPPARMSAAGRGESDPRADNATEAGRQLNRRVEILVSPQT